MSEADPTPVMEETAVANGGAAADNAAPNKDLSTTEVGAQKVDAAMEDKNAEEQNKGSENGIDGPSDGDVKMAEAESAKEGNGGAPKQVDSEDVKMDANAKEGDGGAPKQVDYEDVKMDANVKEGDGGAPKQVDSEDVKMDANAKEGDGGALKQVDSEDVKVDANAKEGDGGASKQVDSEDVKMDANAKEGDGGAPKQVGSEDVKMDANAKEDNVSKTESEDVKMSEAEDNEKGLKEDRDENMNLDKQDELKEQEKGDSTAHEENKGKETSAAEKEKEEEEEEEEKEKETEDKRSTDKKEEAAGDGQINASEEKLVEDSVGDLEKGNEVPEDQVDEDDKVEDNKEETPRNKKARTARDRSQGKDKKQDGSKSREAKSLLNTASPYGTDRPQRERKTVERLVEVIEKEPNRNFVVEKGRGTPLKDIPSVAHRISRRKPAELKFLHSILFGRKGKSLDFKGHILQFSGFVWHESDEKQRAKAKEKLDKCVKDMLLDLCWLLAIPVPKANIRKEDIVSKLLDFIAEPRGVADSGLSDDQGSNSRKRKRGGSASKTPDSKRFHDDTTSDKRQKKALKYDTDDEDESMKSDSDGNKDEDERADELEDDYDSGKEKASKKSSGKKKTEMGSAQKTGPPTTVSKSPARKSSSKISKKESPDDSAKVFSRKRKPTPKGALISEKEIKERRSSGKKVTKGKDQPADLPSKDDLRKTITAILKKVDLNTATFSDILKKLDNHYKMDLTPKKEAIKIMIQDELTKMSEADEVDGSEDTGKKQMQHQTKEVEA